MLDLKFCQLRLMSHGALLAWLFLAACVAPGCLDAASPSAELRNRYDRAQFLLDEQQNHYLLNRTVAPNWIGQEDKFWYCRQTTVGCTYTIVDARTGTKADLFDHHRLAQELEKVNPGSSFDPNNLQLNNIVVAADRMVSFGVAGRTYSLTQEGTLKEHPAYDSESVVSPDGSLLASLRDSNIWVRDLKSGIERQLTSDGEKLFAYASVPDAARGFPRRPELLWSPDSRAILTVQTDDRLVKPLPLVQFVPDSQLRPVLLEQRQAFPGDAHIPMFRMVVIDASSGKQTELHYPWLSAVRMLDTPIEGGRAWWSRDAKHIYFVDIARGEQTVQLISADASTGDTRELFRESNPHGSVELAEDVYGPTTLRLLPKRNQMLWYSERSGYSQLYLYDLATGRLVRQLTHGAAPIRDVLTVDESAGVVWFATSGLSANKNPYYREIGRVDLNTGKETIVSEGKEDRVVLSADALPDSTSPQGFSRTGNYFVETQTRVDTLPRSVIKRADGSEVALLEQAEFRNMPTGFHLPEPVMLTAADGKTPIQAIVARPSDFDPAKRYPVIDYIYGGPQLANVRSSFTGSTVDAQTLAELGFIVVVIDGRGTTGRGRAFHETAYGALETASNLEDQMAGIRQLATRYPYMDLDRVGINGHSAGGYMAATALLRFPDFFKVGVAESGNYDQRDFWYTWGERYEGPFDQHSYAAQADVSYASRLKGKLLLIHGLLDFNVQPGALFQLTQRLIDENKDFDLVLLPKLKHEPSGYGTRRRWDYFVKNLAGLEPPEGIRVQLDGSN